MHFHETSKRTLKPLKRTAACFSCTQQTCCPVLLSGAAGPGSAAEVLRTTGSPPPLRPHRAFALRPLRDEDREPVLLLDHLGTGADHMVRAVRVQALLGLPGHALDVGRLNVGSE